MFIQRYRYHLSNIFKMTSTPIQIDFSNIREERQKINNNIVYDIIKAKNLTELKKHSNTKELNRILIDYNISLEDLIEECNKNDLLAKMTSRHISINATRQGSKDETVQLKTCNITSSKFKININQLPNDALRPCKDGTIVSKKEIVQITSWADKVFSKDYKMLSLFELEKYVNQYTHLPEIPSEADVIKNGVDVAEMNKLLLQKVEELTLHLIELNKKIEKLEAKKQ